MSQNVKVGGRPALSLRRDRRAAAAVEAALVIGPFLMLLFLIIQIGMYFTLQAALDTGVLGTAESLRARLLSSSSFSPPTAAALITEIVSNGGIVLGTFTVAVDVRQLSTLPGSAPVTAGGTTDWGTSGSVLILRAQATMPFLPSTALLTMTSTSIIRRPTY
jgi:Flp pilus assembly protein TadG